MNAVYQSLGRFLLSLVCTIGIQSYQPTLIAMSGHEHSSSSTVVEEILSDTCKKLGLHTNHVYTPTMAYLARPSLRSHLNSAYGSKMNKIGLDYFKILFNDIFAREIDHANRYRVFYHGQEREFVLLQDIYKGLYEITHKKKLHDFIMLRVPDKDFGAYTRVKNFIAHYLKNGEILNYGFNYNPGMQKILLSVNPALFCNTNNSSSCTFDYFLTSSSCTSTNKTHFIKNAFHVFNYEHYFTEHEKEIRKLEALLSKRESDKTGTLLQIFIPEKFVDDIAYRCRVGGVLYHPNEHYKASTDLDDFTFTHKLSNDQLDEIQFRLLITNKMLDPDAGVKTFRYCNETAAMKTYKTELKTLLDTITQKELAKQSSKHVKKAYAYA